jgi:hypothetical protein
MLTSSVAGALIGPAGTLNHPAELATARKLVVRPVLVGAVATATVCEAGISVVVLAKVSPDGLTASDPPAPDGPPTANVIFAKPPVPWRVLIVTWPRYVPAARPEALAAIVILAGVVPLLALTWSHPCVGPKYRTPTSNVVLPPVEVTLIMAVAVVVERAGQTRLISVGAMVTRCWACAIVASTTALPSRRKNTDVNEQNGVSPLVRPKSRSV